MRKSKVKNPSCRPVGPEHDKVLGGHYLYKPTHNVRKYVKKQLLEITFLYIYALVIILLIMIIIIMLWTCIALYIEAIIHLHHDHTHWW